MPEKVRRSCLNSHHPKIEDIRLKLVTAAQTAGYFLVGSVLNIYFVLHKDT